MDDGRVFDSPVPGSALPIRVSAESRAPASGLRLTPDRVADRDGRRSRRGPAQMCHLLDSAGVLGPRTSAISVAMDVYRVNWPARPERMSQSGCHGADRAVPERRRMRGRLPAVAPGMAGRLSGYQRRSVWVPHHRLAPDHPLPAAIDVAVTAYRWVLARGHATSPDGRRGR
jgi:hypothetical protein